MLTPLQTALIIEDSPMVAAHLARYLLESNVRSIVHPTAKGALEQARSERPDLILLDIGLPGGDDGWSLLTALKADPGLQSIPVIVASVIDDRGRARSLGAEGYLVKPINRDDLRSAIFKVGTKPAVKILPVAAPAAAAPSGPLILLAEDNAVNARTVRDFLIASRYRVELAVNGEEAVEKARHLLPGLILMDIQMPGMDGLEATRQLRADPAMRDIPIVAVTALAMPGDRERCIEAGANDYLTKPLSLKQLRAVVEMLLEQPKRV